jgi:cytochrome c-type biogenesis protein
VETAITSLFLGLLATTSPCVLPLYPGFIAYLSGQTALASSRRRALLGPSVLAGVMTTMLAIGAVIAALAISISSALAVIIPLADIAILALGAALLLDRNPFRALPAIRVPVLRSPLLNAYAYGLLYGPIAVPCSGPLVVAIFALSFTVNEALGRLWVFLWFGLGFGVPLLILSVLSATLQHRLTRIFARHGRAINVIGGFLLVGVAILDLAQNWALIVAFYT